MICNFCEFQNKLGLLIEEYEEKDDADYEKYSGHIREMGNHFCEDEDCEGFDKGEDEDEDSEGFDKGEDEDEDSDNLIRVMTKMKIVKGLTINSCVCGHCAKSRIPQYINFNA